MDDFTGNIRKTEITPLEAIDQLGVIESQQMQNCCMQVMDMHLVLNHIEPQIVAFTHRESLFDATACHPHCEGIGVVVTSIIGTTLYHWCTAELTTPQDQCVIQQSTLFEVLDQRSAGTVCVLAVLGQSLGQCVMLVPARLRHLRARFG